MTHEYVFPTTPPPWQIHEDNDGIGIYATDADGTAGPQIATVLHETIDGDTDAQMWGDAFLMGASSMLQIALRRMVAMAQAAGWQPLLLEEAELALSMSDGLQPPQAQLRNVALALTAQQARAASVSRNWPYGAEPVEATQALLQRLEAANALYETACSFYDDSVDIRDNLDEQGEEWDTYKQFRTALDDYEAACEGMGVVFTGPPPVAAPDAEPQVSAASVRELLDALEKDTKEQDWDWIISCVGNLREQVGESAVA